MEEDWADNESVTTDEENTNPCLKKNIHARRWTLVSKKDGLFVIEGGRMPKEVHMPLTPEVLKNQKSLADADFVL